METPVLVVRVATAPTHEATYLARLQGGRKRKTVPKNNIKHIIRSGALATQATSATGSPAEVTGLVVQDEGRSLEPTKSVSAALYLCVQFSPNREGVGALIFKEEQASINISDRRSKS